MEYVREYVRDYAMYASVFGMFSFIWFGWAQESPKPSWRLYWQGIRYCAFSMLNGCLFKCDELGCAIRFDGDIGLPRLFDFVLCRICFGWRWCFCADQNIAWDYFICRFLFIRGIYVRVYSSECN